MLDISCPPNSHLHYWHDPVFNQDMIVPESFLHEVRLQLELPLQQLKEAAARAMSEMGTSTLAYKILAEALIETEETVIGELIPDDE